jgi:hypothetical protein
MIHIGRARTVLGQFTEEETRAGLQAGRFLPTDLGWTEGMETWVPLSEMPVLTAPPPLPEPLPPLPGEDLPPLDAGEAPVPDGLPWEVHGLGRPALAFLATVRFVLVTPRDAFQRMRTAGNIAAPLVYNLVGGWIGIVAASLFAVMVSHMEAPPGPGDTMAKFFYMPPDVAEANARSSCILAPVFVTIFMLATAVLAHLFMKLTGGARKPFHVTLRVICYSIGSSFMLLLFPLFGGMMALAWLVVCSVIGMKTAHETTAGRVIAAMVLCFATGLLALFALAAAAPGMGN